MKKLTIIILVIQALIIISGCTPTPDPLTAPLNHHPIQPRDFDLPDETDSLTVETMSNELMLAIAQYEDTDFVFPEHYTIDDFGVPFLKNEVWRIADNSVSSREEYLQEYASSDETETTYIGENDLYYSFRTKYKDKETKKTGVIRVIVFKSSAIFHTETTLISPESLNYETVLHLLDLETFRQGSSYIVIHRELTETDDEFIYTYYTISRMGHVGVEGIVRAHMYSANIHVDKKTCEVDRPDKNLLRNINKLGETLNHNE